MVFIDEEEFEFGWVEVMCCVKCLNIRFEVVEVDIFISFDVGVV